MRMNSKKIFQQRQRELLQLANSPAGRFLLDCGVDAPIIGITPNAILYAWKGQFRGEFYAGENRNANILLPILQKLDIAQEHRVLAQAQRSFLRQAEIPWIFLTEYEAASGGTGGIYAANATYSTARSASTASGSEQGVKNEFVGGNYEIARWFCPTDFSAITPGSDVTAATGAIYPTARNTTVDDTLKFIVTTQAATNSVANDDFDNLTLNSPTTYGTFGAYSTLNLNAYNSITMDAGFQTLVESGAGGYIKMGLRSTGDIDNSTPAARSFLTMSQTNAQRTKFDVTWTAPSGGALFLATFI